jgi:25S rRNA (uracil2634-N3)-methyltransferase
VAQPLEFTKSDQTLSAGTNIVSVPTTSYYYITTIRSAMGKGKSLKSALISHQSRLDKKHKAAQAVQIAEQKRKGKGTAPPPRPTIPFQCDDKILLVGEGNFSFARALALNPPSSLKDFNCAGVTATSYDTEHECFLKYPDAEAIVVELRGAGVEVLFGIDATNLQKYPSLKNRRWDKIVFNFPHAGAFLTTLVQFSSHVVLIGHPGKGITDQDRNILSNQTLMLDFFASAAPCLTIGPMPEILGPRRNRRKDRDGDDTGDSDNEMSDGDASTMAAIIKQRGTVLVTLRNVPPYTEWSDSPKFDDVCVLTAWSGISPDWLNIRLSEPMPSDLTDRTCC